MIEIRHRHTGAVLLTVEAETLRGADLRFADLPNADLRGADLTGADLRVAFLRRANLRRADLTGANLEDANLRGAFLRGADLTGADLTGADLTGANLAGATLPRGVPVVPQIDAAILAAIEAGGELDMLCWHDACGTTHCRAGWAIHLAGEAGYALEERFGPGIAGALIYAASDPTRPIPKFLDVRAADALADMRQRAGRTP